MKLTKFQAVNGHMTYAVELSEASDIYCTRAILERLPEKIADLIAEHYVSTYKEELLKTINQKLIDGKVIAKVIKKIKEGK